MLFLTKCSDKKMYLCVGWICFHIVCTECFILIIRKMTNWCMRVIKCTVCARITEFSQAGIHDLPKDLVISALVEVRVTTTYNAPSVQMDIVLAYDVILLCWVTQILFSVHHGHLQRKFKLKLMFPDSIKQEKT